MTSETCTFTVTLASLRRTIDRFKTALKQPQQQNSHQRRSRYPTTTTEPECPVPTKCSTSDILRFATSEEQALANFDKDVTKSREQLQKTLTLSRDLAVLKDTLYAANAEHKIDCFLTDIAQLENEQSILQKMLESISSEKFSRENVTQLYVEKAQHESKLGPRGEILPYIGCNVVLHTQSELETRIRAIKQQLTVLEERRNELNYKYRATVTISRESFDFLGLVNDSVESQ